MTTAAEMKKAKATILIRPKGWSQRDIAALMCSHRVAIHNSGKIVVEGHHEKEKISRALGLNPGRLGDNDFQHETTEIDIPA
jgi:hypothetical protein